MILPWYLPSVTISHNRTPKLHTSDFVVKMLSKSDSGAIHLWKNICVMQRQKRKSTKYHNGLEKLLHTRPIIQRFEIYTCRNIGLHGKKVAFTLTET